MHKISLIFSGILFLLGCITLGATMFFSDILPRVFDVYLMAHPISYAQDMLRVNSTNIYILAVAEFILGALGYFYHRKKLNDFVGISQPAFSGSIER